MIKRKNIIVPKSGCQVCPYCQKGRPFCGYGKRLEIREVWNEKV
jgi:hypothetical protein